MLLISTSSRHGRTDSNFETAMVHVEQPAAVSTSALEVVPGVNDDEKLTYVELPQATDDSYTITLSSTLESSYHDVQLTGATGQGVPVLTQVAGRLYANGVDLSANTSLTIEGVSVPTNVLSASMTGAKCGIAMEQNGPARFDCALTVCRRSAVPF